MTTADRLRTNALTKGQRVLTLPDGRPTRRVTGEVREVAELHTEKVKTNGRNVTRYHVVFVDGGEVWTTPTTAWTPARDQTVDGTGKVTTTKNGRVTLRAVKAKPAAKALSKLKAGGLAVPDTYTLRWPHKSYSLYKRGAGADGAAWLVSCNEHGRCTEAASATEGDKLGSKASRPGWCQKCAGQQQGRA